MKFRQDHLPLTAKRLIRRKDFKDVNAIKESYFRGSSAAPVEMGVVELLDEEGKTIDSTSVQGTYKHMTGFNSAVLRLLEANSEQLDRIRTIRKRHTHPQDSQNSLVPDAFSDGDMADDKILGDFLDSKPEYKKIRAESWIIYVDPSLERFYPDELTKKNIRTRGYLIH